MPPVEAWSTPIAEKANFREKLPGVYKDEVGFKTAGLK